MEEKMEKQKIEWETTLSLNKERDIGWYLTFGIILIILLIYALFSKNFLFALILILGAILIVKQPIDRKIKCLLDDEGFKIVNENKIYEYEDIENFYIFENTNELTQLHILVFNFKKRIIPHLKINIPKEKTEEIKNFLIQKKVAYKEYEQGLLDKLIDSFF